MRQPARADERRLRADNNGKRREQAADETGRRGRRGSQGGRCHESGRQEAETVHKRQTRTNGLSEERRWWAADDVTRVGGGCCDESGRR